MTFLHKLARRLARLKAGTLAAVAVVSAAAAFVGCELPISEPLPTVSRLVVSPKTVTLTPDQSQDFMAVGYTATGDTAQVDVTWTTTAGSVSDKGTQRGRHYGWYKNGLCGGSTVTATAHPGNVSDAASVTVICPGTLGSVVVTPPTSSMLVGQTAQLTATALDTSGNVLTGFAASWSSSNPAVAMVDGSGLVTALAAGLATITATGGGKSGSAAITVTAPVPEPVAAERPLPV